MSTPLDASLLDALLDAAPDAMLVVDAAGAIILANAEAETLFGYPRASLVGRPVDILVPDVLRAAHGADRERYAAAPHRRPMGSGAEFAGRRRDGSEFPAEISLSAIESPDGMFVAAAIRDGTERLRAAIVRSSTDAIVSQALDGTITSWNPGAVRMYGYEAPDVLGQSIDVLIPAEHRARERALLAGAARGEPVAEYEAVQRCADGGLIDIARTAAPMFDSAGKVVGISTIARDITATKRAAIERQALEERLNESQRLESLGQLAGGIAHDFNNLLAVILNYATFVSEQITDNASASADLEQIRIAAERATLLTRQLLIFGRRETVQPETLDLNAVVEGIRVLLGRAVGEHVELVVRPSGAPAAVYGDRGQLEQVLVNLAVNARDAMPAGGTLTIETGRAELAADSALVRPGLRAGTYVNLSVSDTGTGMTQAVIDRAFEPFFTTKPRGEGTGLGLATVYGVVTQAGGAAILSSGTGAGTTVSIYLPATKAAVSAPTSGEPTIDLRRGKGETILVVEDEEAMRAVAVRVLIRNGYRVLEARGGAHALSILERERCDLLLTDVVMPQMLGHELAARAHEVCPDLPVLFMSGYSEGVLGPQGILDKGVSLIQKPFDERALLERIGAILARVS